MSGSGVVWPDVHVGDELTPLELEMTATRIVAGAIATRDFMPVHHDRDFANQQGAPDIFMNILSTNAYCSRFLTDWAGPEARITRLAIRLGVPVHPDSTLRFTGTILLVKHLDIESDEVFQNYRRVPSGLTFAQGVDLLKKESVPLS